jgi:hypothetical protein
MALEQHEERSGDQFGMIARHRHEAPFAHVEGDRRKVRRRGGLPPARRDGVELVGREQIVERHHAVLAPKPHT